MIYAFLDVGCAKELYIVSLASKRDYSSVDISESKLIRAKDYSANLRNLGKVVKELFHVSKRFVILQSSAYLKKFTAKITPRSYDKVRLRFYSNPFAGALWSISPRALIKLGNNANKGIKVCRVIRCHFILNIFLHRLRSQNKEKVIQLINNLENLGVSKKFFNLLCKFTTIMFEELDK